MGRGCLVVMWWGRGCLVVVWCGEVLFGGAVGGEAVWWWCGVGRGSLVVVW